MVMSTGSGLLVSRTTIIARSSDGASTANHWLFQLLSVGTVGVVPGT